jgi:hypothetical protein
MSLKKRKYRQKGGALSPEKLKEYEQIYTELLYYDSQVDLENVQKTEIKLLNIYLVRKNLTSKEYITSLQKKLSDLFEPKIVKDQNNPKSEPVRIYEPEPFTKYYKIEDLATISLVDNLYKSSKYKHNIANINQDIIKLGGKYIKNFYSNDREFDIFLLRLSKMFKKFTCINTPSYKAKVDFMIHYLNLRLISILNKFYILYIAVPILFYELYMYSGNCFDTPVISSIKSTILGKIFEQSILDKKKLFLSHNIVDIYDLFSEMIVSKNEADMFVNSLTKLPEETVMRRLLNYPKLKSFIVNTLLFSTLLGYGTAFSGIFALTSVITEALVTDADDENFQNMRFTNHLINRFFTSDNTTINEDDPALITKNGLKVDITKLKSNIDPELITKIGQLNITKINKFPNSCDEEFHLDDITETIQEHEKIVFEKYDSIKFYCYVFETIISWQCNTREVGEVGEGKTLHINAADIPPNTIPRVVAIEPNVDIKSNVAIVPTLGGKKTRKNRKRKTQKRSRKGKTNRRS